MAKASENALGDLHNTVAQQLTDLLKAEPGNLAAINAAMKFLKDNRIECEAETSAVAGLRTVLPFGADEAPFDREEIRA